MTAKRRKERIPMRVVRAGSLPPETGVFFPADGLARGRLRARKYHVGSTVFAEFRKPRNPGFHRLAHAFGKLLSENLEAFAGLNCHWVLKRLQAESGIGCDPLAMRVHGQTVIANIPRSISYESMDQGEFDEVFYGLVDYVRREYWPTVKNREIVEMAEAMIDDDS